MLKKNPYDILESVGSSKVRDNINAVGVSKISKDVNKVIIFVPSALQTWLRTNGKQKTSQKVIVTMIHFKISGLKSNFG